MAPLYVALMAPVAPLSVAFIIALRNFDGTVLYGFDGTALCSFDG
jgi:hypothetical protein